MSPVSENISRTSPALASVYVYWSPRTMSAGPVPGTPCTRPAGFTVTLVLSTVATTARKPGVAANEGHARMP